ncbi:MAG TPA: hypothetical protein VGO11_08775 [Chthoniobacteraceae bacterium]|nr:hypothetical protein [Chthoniobacteraceae bacterium]
MDNAALFNVLRDIDRAPNANHALNPKRQVFFAGNAVSNPQRPKGGFLETASSGGAQGAYYDPWGSQYNIVIDSNLDGSLEVSGFYPDFAGPAVPKVEAGGAGVFSLGKDRQLGIGKDHKYKDGTEVSDDILSWFVH